MINTDIASLKLFEIIELFKSQVQLKKSIITITISQIQLDRYSFGSFYDLGNSFGYKLCIPKADEIQLTLKYEKLNEKNSFHNDQISSEKYGIQSKFFQINKNDKFSFLYHFTQALKNIKINDRKSILNLGINKGDEFDILLKVLSNQNAHHLIGIDISRSAITYAKERFSKLPNMQFYCADINQLQELNLSKFDCLISIGTLQSSSLNLKTTLMNLVQNQLNKNSAIVLGFPNCRWIENEMIYGAKVPNYNFSELGTLINDLAFCKKYLQQKKYRVMITGKDYIFLSAVKI
jgi:SAM-dependent methyltransferase